jgi:hypothetical protein
MPYNAGATASDTLRMGVPIVTCPGRTCVSRMAASLRTAVGLPDLAVPSLADYRACAIDLAQNPSRLAEIRARLALGARDGPLFDVARTTRNLEALYLKMHERSAAGAPPIDLRLTRLWRESRHLVASLVLHLQPWIVISLGLVRPRRCGRPCRPVFHGALGTWP